MNSYYFVIEVEAQAENPLIAHVSRAVVHMWVLSNELNEARDTAFRFLKSNSWDTIEEKDGYLATPEQIEELGTVELSNYQVAQSEGIHAMFYYWHRSE